MLRKIKYKFKTMTTLNFYNIHLSNNIELNKYTYKYSFCSCVGFIKYKEKRFLISYHTDNKYIPN